MLESRRRLRRLMHAYRVRLGVYVRSVRALLQKNKYSRVSQGYQKGSCKELTWVLQGIICTSLNANTNTNGDSGEYHN